MPPAPPGVYPPPSPSPWVPYPYNTPDATQAAIQTRVAGLAMTLTAEPTRTPSPTSQAYLEDTIANMKKLGAIMLEDNGRTFTYYETQLRSQNRGEGAAKQPLIQKVV